MILAYLVLQISHQKKNSKKIDPDDLEICSRSLSFKLDVHPYMGDQL